MIVFLFSFVFIGFPEAHFSFVCSSHGGGRLAQDGRVDTKRVVESELVSRLRTHASG